MASLQSTIPFVVKKRTAARISSTKSSGKENLRKGSLNVLNSPVKGLNTASTSPVKSSSEACILSSPLKSPRKRPSISGVEGVSPPKLYPSPTKGSPVKSPSHLINNISLRSPQSKPQAQKELFPKAIASGSACMRARRALHSSSTPTLPEREGQVEELRRILHGCLDTKNPASLYVSGAPGTGKTAVVTALLSDPKVKSEYKVVYVNCTGLKSPGTIYTKIAKDLSLSGTSEKAAVAAIEKYLKTASKMTLLVLDEMDQLSSRSQKVLYRVFEWPGKGPLVLVGVANSLDLTSRTLPWLESLPTNVPRPSLHHFAPYTKKQLATIIEDRLRQAGADEVLSGGALQMLAGKVASVSGDARRALDLARRVIDISETGSVSLRDVMGVLKDVYSTSESISSSGGGGEGSTSDPFPLQQKLLVSTLLLLKKHSKPKEITVGRLHDVYKKVCSKRNLSSVELSEFLSIVELVETRGALRSIGKTRNRLSKVALQWDESELSSALQDKELLASVLSDISCLNN